MQEKLENIHSDPFLNVNQLLQGKLILEVLVKST